MTAILVEDGEVESALATMRQSDRQPILDRLSLLEATTAKVLRAVCDDGAISQGASAAHALAGALGTFGCDAGSRAALEAEALLRERVIDGRLLVEMVTALRTAIEDLADSSEGLSSAAGVTTHREALINVISCDADLINRLQVEAASIGLVASSAATLPVDGHLSTRLAPLVIVDATGPWTRSYMLKSLAAMTRKTNVIVLTDSERFEERVELARVGVARVLPRLQATRQVVSFVGEAIERRANPQSTVLALNIEGGLLDALSSAMAGGESLLEILDNPSAFWRALEERGADLAIIGFAGQQLSGPELCRVIRTHPYWYRLPVFVVGAQDMTSFADAMSAGADDYLISTTSQRDLGVRMGAYIEWRRLSGVRRDVRPVTGTDNQPATEEVVDRVGADDLIRDGSPELASV
jgi:DNA-binding response OmpR family regulator